MRARRADESSNSGDDYDYFYPQPCEQSTVTEGILDKVMKVVEVAASTSSAIPDLPPVNKRYDPVNPLKGDYMSIRYDRRDQCEDEGVILWFATMVDGFWETFRCVLDPEKCLEGSGTWQRNQILLKGHTRILKNALYEYLDALKRKAPDECHFEVDLTKRDNMVMRKGNLYPIIYFLPFKAPIRERLFEKCLRKAAKPWLKGNTLNDCLFVTLHNTGYVDLAPEDSFYTRIQQILEKNYPGIEDPANDAFLKCYVSHIDDVEGRNFVARLDGQPGPFYRVRIIEEIIEERFADEEDHGKPKYLFRKFKVSYIDVGLTRVLKLSDFVCIGTHSKLPPLMHRLPPQVVNCFMKYIHPKAAGLSMTTEYKFLGDREVTVQAQVVKEVPVPGCEPNVVICDRLLKGSAFNQEESFNHELNQKYREWRKDLKHDRTHGDVKNLAKHYLNMIIEDRKKAEENDSRSNVLGDKKL